jgi:hypothetical protein
VSEPGPTSPDWIRAAVRSTLEELRSFSVTGWAFIRHPKRFGEQWATSAIRRLNPFAFMATALAIVSAAGVVRHRAAHDDAALWQIVRDSLTPYAHYLGVGICAQAILRLLGGHRPFRDAAAMAIYVGAIVSLLVGLLSLGHRELTLSGISLLWLIVPLAVFYVPLALSMTGLYHGSRVGGGRVAVALAFTFVASGLFFGMVKPAGKYGVHFTLEYHHSHTRDPDGTENDEVDYGYGFTDE